MVDLVEAFGELDPGDLTLKFLCVIIIAAMRWAALKEAARKMLLSWPALREPKRALIFDN